MEEVLVDCVYLLQKFEGKGGWTYAEIPEIKPDHNSPFGWVKVRGNIDDFTFKNYRLQPMGNGKLFLPVKAEIRKKIGKNAGDRVRITLYKDETPLDTPEELVTCLKNDPDVYTQFLRLSEGKQKALIEWIYSAKSDETKVNRIVSTMEQLQQELLSKNLKK